MESIPVMSLSLDKYGSEFVSVLCVQSGIINSKLDDLQESQVTNIIMWESTIASFSLL